MTFKTETSVFNKLQHKSTETAVSGLHFVLFMMPLLLIGPVMTLCSWSPQGHMVFVFGDQKELIRSRWALKVAYVMCILFG